MRIGLIKYILKFTNVIDNLLLIHFCDSTIYDILQHLIVR